LSDATPALQRLELLIEDLALSLRIGVGAAERSTPQRILATLQIEVAPRQPRQDSVGEVVDYGVIAERVRALADGERQLLETLAAEIAAAALADPRVAAVTVTLRKPDLFADCGAVGIRASYCRPATSQG